MNNNSNNINNNSNGADDLYHTIQIDEGIPFRTLTYPSPPSKAPRTSPLFYHCGNEGLPVRTQEQILRDSDRMNELISDLLDLSSMETSDIEMEVIDLHEVISNEISYLSKQNKKRVGYKKTK